MTGLVIRNHENKRSEVNMADMIMLKQAENAGTEQKAQERTGTGGVTGSPVPGW